MKLGGSQYKQNLIGNSIWLFLRTVERLLLAESSRSESPITGCPNDRFR